MEDEGTVAAEGTPVAAEGTPVANSGNPAWGELLSSIPSALHDVVTPHLTKWDSGVQSQFEKYKPYEQFVGTPANEIEAGLNIFRALNADPKALYDQLAEHYNFNSTVEDNPVDEEFDTSIASNPVVRQLQEQQQQLLAREEARVAQEADVWLKTQQAKYSAELEAKGITPDWEFILTRASATAQQIGDNDKAMASAVAAFENLVGKYRAPVANAGAPPVFKPNSSVASTTFDPSKMSPDERRSFVAQLITQQLKE